MITLQDLLDELARLEIPCTEKQIYLQFKSGKFSPEVGAVAKRLIEEKTKPVVTPPKVASVNLFTSMERPIKWAVPREELIKTALERLEKSPLSLRELSVALNLDNMLTRELTYIMRKRGLVVNRRHGETDLLVWALVGDKRTRPKYSKNDSPREIAYRARLKTFFGVPCGNCGSTLKYTECRACVPCSKQRVETRRNLAKGVQS